MLMRFGFENRHEDQLCFGHDDSQTDLVRIRLLNPRYHMGPMWTILYNSLH